MDSAAERDQNVPNKKSLSQCTPQKKAIMEKVFLEKVDLIKKQLFSSLKDLKQEYDHLFPERWVIPLAAFKGITEELTKFEKEWEKAVKEEQDSFFEELERKRLEKYNLFYELCPVCYQPFKRGDFRKLQCGHSYCVSCIFGLVKMESDSLRASYPISLFVNCPTCRKRHNVPIALNTNDNDETYSIKNIFSTEPHDGIPPFPSVDATRPVPISSRRTQSIPTTIESGLSEEEEEIDLEETSDEDSQDEEDHDDLDDFVVRDE